MQIAGHDIGVCSWSVKPNDMADLAARMKELGLEHVQLALGPLIRADEQKRQGELAVLRDSGLKITAGMISFRGESYSSIANIRETGGYLPDAPWPQRREDTLRAAELAVELGVRQISTHIGFVPPSNNDRYKVMLERVGDIADSFASDGLVLLLETGQERAPELLQFLNDLPSRNVRANFDPANMILYGAGEPIEAIRILSRHIGHVHVKDAVMSDQPGTTWGVEVPFGTGQVPPEQFLRALGEGGYEGPLIIEREAGEDRMADVRTAVETLRRAAG
jgi:L-ribulose-5-phosphate 3-epimerase